ncbi:HAD family hydrolase [Zobellella maritima]|uniref:HAD family hydrolase n=1 Tax=Zobellella maritima TaxID=2059725 RepID=UPI000E302964|nr:HAD family hydrolase [Zobellella maritima]
MFFLFTFIRQIFSIVHDYIVLNRVGESVLKRKSGEPSLKVISFDLFDTCILRKENLSYENQYKVCSLLYDYLKCNKDACDLDEFIGMRNFFFNLSKPSIGYEVNINKAYESLLQHLILTDAIALTSAEVSATIEKMIDIEVCHEISNCIANDNIFDLIKEIKVKNQRVIAISDMYLPLGCINRILDSIGLSDVFDCVYVSSEMEVTKCGGEIFEKVCELEGIKLCNLMHVGDNYTSDVIKPRKAGVNAFFYFDIKNELKRAWSSSRNVSSHVKDSAKLKRPDTAEGSIKKTITEFMAVYFAEVIRVAKINKVGKVNFCTRDASILLVVSEKIQSKGFFNDIEFSSLSLNRRLSSFLNAQYVWVYRDYLTLYEKVGFDSKFYSVQDNGAGWVKLAEINGSGYELLLQESFRPILNGFIEQISLLNKYFHDKLDDSVIVDIGYAATAFEDLYRYQLRNQFSCNNFFILGASSQRVYHTLQKANSTFPLWPGFLLDHSKIPDLATLSFSWLESIVSDKQLGRLVRYEYDKGVVQPVFEESKGINDVSFIDDIVSNVIDLLLDDYLKNPEVRKRRINNLIDLVGGSVISPSRNDVLSVIKQSHNVGECDESSSSIVRRLKIRNPIKEVRCLIKEDRWVSGCLKLSGLGRMNGFFSALICAEKYIRSNIAGGR